LKANKRTISRKLKNKLQPQVTRKGFSMATKSFKQTPSADRNDNEESNNGPKQKKSIKKPA
jgi:hypothetical protein